MDFLQLYCYGRLCRIFLERFSVLHHQKQTTRNKLVLEAGHALTLRVLASRGHPHSPHKVNHNYVRIENYTFAPACTGKHELHYQAR